jgi:hypothetical protein
MGAVIAPKPWCTLRDRRLSRALAAGLALLVLGSAITLGGPSIARAAKPASTPTFPVPASAQAPSPTAGAGAAGAATTPTTTYAPSGGATAPSSSPAATTSTATTPPAATASATPAPATPGAQTTAPAQTSAARAKAGKGDRPLSTGAIVIAALAALLVLVCAAWAIARSRALEPHWLLSLRHAMAEAGFRASATWSEFADWARLGR